MTQAQQKVLARTLRHVAIRALELRKELSSYETYAINTCIDADEAGKEAMSLMVESLSLLAQCRKKLITASDTLSQASLQEQQ